jgi:hypothetical protein
VRGNYCILEASKFALTASRFRPLGAGLSAIENMKPFLISAAFVFFAQVAWASPTQDSPSTPSLAMMIVGKWAEKASNSVLQASGTTEYLPDGTARMETTATVFGKKLLTVTVKGLWRIVGRQLIMTATESSHPKLLPPGEDTRDEIVSITSTELVLLDEDGKRQVSERIR